MKKINLIMSCLVILSVKLLAQSTPAEGTVEYDKVQVPCYKMDIPVSEDVAKEAIKERFKKMGVKGKEKKDFLEFKDVTIPEIRSGKVDAYIKVERKGKKENNISEVSMILTEPGVAPGAASSGGGAAVVAGVTAVGAFGLLSSLNESSATHGLNLDIKEQEKLIKKAEEKYNDAIKDGNSLQDKLKKVQNDIESNRNDQTKLAEELQKQKEKLLQIQSGQKMLPGKKD